MTIKELREKQNLTQQALADKSGVALITIGRYERNERVPSIANLFKIANAAGCPFQELAKEYIKSA